MDERGPLGFPVGPLRRWLRSVLRTYLGQAQAPAPRAVRNQERWTVTWRDDGTIGGLIIDREAHEDGP